MSTWQYEDWEYLLSAVLLVTAMIGMGASLSPIRFLRVLLMPRGILVAFFLQAAISPLLAWGVSRLLGLTPAVALALLLVAALPGGLFSNLLTYMGRANVALSITVTAVATLGCTLVTPALLGLFAGEFLPQGLEMPVQRILFEILVCLLLPLALGMGLRRAFPGQARQIASFGTRLSLLLLIVMVVAGLASGRVSLASVGWRGILGVILFCQALIWASYGLCLLLRFHRSDALTIMIEVVVRNVHLAIFLKASLFPAADPVRGPIGNAVLSAVLVYGGFSVVFAGIEVFSKRRRIGLIFGRKRGGRKEEG